MTAKRHDYSVQVFDCTVAYGLTEEIAMLKAFSKSAANLNARVTVREGGREYATFKKGELQPKEG